MSLPQPDPSVRTGVDAFGAIVVSSILTPHSVLLDTDAPIVLCRDDRIRPPAQLFSSAHNPLLISVFILPPL